MKHIWIILSLVRFHNLCLGALAVYVSSYLLGFMFSVEVIRCIFVVCSIMALGNLMNDYLDIKSDKINHPERPLIKYKINNYQLLCVCLILLLILFYFSLKLNQLAVSCLLFLVIPLLISYNLFLKKIPLFGNLIVAFLLGFVFLFTEIALFNSFDMLRVPFFLTIIFTFLRELIKDVEDQVGDAANYIKTIPIILGEKKTRHLLVIVTFFILLLLPTPYFLGIYTIKYLLLLIIFIEIPLIYSLFLLIKFPSKRTYKFLVKLLKFLCFIGLVIFMIENK